MYAESRKMFYISLPKLVITSNFVFCFSGTNILLPKMVVPGQSTTALVHFHNKNEQHNVTLRLIRPASKFHDYELHTDVLAQNTVLIKGKI